MRRSLGKLPEGKQDSDAHTEDKRETPRQTLGGTEGSKRKGEKHKDNGDGRETRTELSRETWKEGVRQRQ